MTTARDAKRYGNPPSAPRLRRVRLGELAIALCLAASCDGGGTLGERTASSFRPEADGFAFANFRSAEYSESFDAEAFVALVGNGPRVCVEGTAAKCVLTEEAAAFATMVNELRADGHCEGMVVLAAVRFNQGTSRKSVDVPDSPEAINAIIRGFATMFLPEVQAEARYWMSESLADLVTVLSGALEQDRMEFGLGIYTSEGGHEVLPYAIEYPRRNVARIMVYDPNWPMQERYVDLNLETDTWTFPFSAANPAADLHPWTGGRRDLDLNSISVRVRALNALRSEMLDPTGTIWE